jgi:hypothetical protein
MYIQAKSKYHHFHAPQYRNCLRSGTKYSMVHGGNIWKWEKIPFFFPPLIFLQVFLSQVGKKTGPGGKILYCFSSSSYPRSCPQLRYCHKKRLCSAWKIWFDFPLAIFSPQYTVCESRKIIAWPKGEKIKTLGEKI